MKSVHSAAPPATARPSVVLLVRHAATDALGAHLCGRLAGVSLNIRGHRESRRLAAQLARLPVAALYSSPMTRALQTAGPLAAALALDVTVEPRLNEVDFGSWTGCRFDDLASRNEWRVYNECRDAALIPGGESPADTMSRITRTLHDLHRRHPAQMIVAVTHAELVRYAILAARAASLRRWHSVSVATTSVTAIRVTASKLTELPLDTWA